MRYEGEGRTVSTDRGGGGGGDINRGEQPVLLTFT
jgi:hypothetical protein